MIFMLFQVDKGNIYTISNFNFFKTDRNAWANIN